MSARSSAPPAERPPVAGLPPVPPPSGGDGDGGGGDDRDVRVAVAANQAEAEFLQGLLAEEGIPSYLRRTAGFDLPEMLAAGPRDVIVRGRDERAARQALLQAGVAGAREHRGTDPYRLLAVLIVVLLVAWLALRAAFG